MQLLKSHAALLAVNLLYGINYLVAKGLMPGVIGANGFIFLRVSGATILFWILFSFRFEKVTKKDLILLALCGVFGVGVNQLFFFNGLMRTSPVNASVFMVITPILVLILSLIFLKETIRKVQIVGVVIGASAAVVFSLQNTADSFATSLGDLFIFFNAVSYAIYLILVKPLMSRYNALTVITWVFTFGLIVVLIWPYSFSEFPLVDWNELSGTTVSKVIFVIIGVTFLPYLLMVYAMKNVSATVASVYIYIQPILATFFVYLYSIFGLEDYSRDISVVKLICTALIFAGVYLVIKPAKVNPEIKTSH
ncbi:MAG: EamA family transporter [Crocinitomicaceae bacterium]|nr:EamA family transporter [Crocinitomicaceae bacterium]